MESATLFLIGIGFIATLELGARLAAGIGWLGKRLGMSPARDVKPGQRADVYTFFRLRDLYGTDQTKIKPARRREQTRKAPRRQRPALTSSPR